MQPAEFAMLDTPQLPGLLGSAAGILPMWPLELGLSQLTRAIAQRHPGLFDRLGVHEAKRIVIAPTDFPAVFVLHLHRDQPSAEVRPEGSRPPCDARVAGPLLALMDLAEGNRDGDALFFARDIDIEGDVSALLALRNALDGEGLDLIEEMVSPLGPLAASVGAAVRRLVQLLLWISRAAPAAVAAP
jgi:predicted lipid carrier protein YhbT